MSDDGVEISGGIHNRQRITDGVDFQDRLTKQILAAFAGYRTVTIEDMDGNIIDHRTARRRGADGGLDLVIRIDAKTPAAMKRIARKVETVLLSLK